MRRGKWRQQMQKLPIGPCAGSCGTAAYRGSPVIVSDISTDPLWNVPEHRACALGHGLRASWSSPVLSSAGKVLGTFCMYYREPRSPNTQDLELIELATRLAWIAIGRDQAAQAPRRSEAYLAEAQKLTHTGSWAFSPRGGTYYWSEEMFRIWGFDPGLRTAIRRGSGSIRTISKEYARILRRPAEVSKWCTTIGSCSRMER